MDPTIIAAIIGAIAVIVAALIGIVRRKGKVTPSKECFEKSRWLRLGCAFAELERKRWWDAEKWAFSQNPNVYRDFDIQYYDEVYDAAINTEANTKWAYEIAKELGISIDPELRKLVEELPVIVDAKPIVMKNAFKTGVTIGRIFFVTKILMARDSHPINEIKEAKEEVEEGLDEAKPFLRGANLPPDFLKPVRKLWEESLESWQKVRGKTFERVMMKQRIKEQIEGILDELCKDIETDFRHTV